MNFKVLSFLFLSLILFCGFSKKGITTKKVTYNNHHQKMVFCVDQNQTDETINGKPFILLIHGGAWTTGLGRRQEFLSHCKYLAQQGYTAATMSYRLSPLHRYPAAPNDVKDAILWLKKNSHQFKIGSRSLNADKILLIGHSAGAHLALLTGLKEKDLSLFGIVSLAGPTDLSTKKACKICNREKRIFLHHTPPEEASPISYVRSDAPPIFIFHGDKDHIVDINQSKKLEKALKKVGAPVLLEVLPDTGHFFPFKSKDKLEVEKEILRFVTERGASFCRRFFDETHSENGAKKTEEPLPNHDAGNGLQL